jgi:putative acetyltransferase
LNVRPYASADLDTVVALFRASVRTVARRDYSQEQILAWAPDEINRDHWLLRLAASGTWLAAEVARVIGFISMEPEGRLDMLYVHPDFQRRGIATALLRRAEQSARSQGLATLSTEASITARPFFERHGFHVIVLQTVVRRGQELRNYRMARLVS